MPKYTQQQLEERYQKLPPVLQKAMFDPKISESIFSLGQENELTIEQIGILAEEIGNIILGLTKAEEFNKVLEEALQIETPKISLMVQEINKRILMPLREALKSAHGLEIKADAPTQTPAAKPELPKFMQGLSTTVEKGEKPELIIHPEPKLAATSPAQKPVAAEPIKTPTVQPATPIAPKPETAAKPPSAIPAIDLRSVAKPATPSPTVPFQPAPAQPKPTTPSAPPTIDLRNVPRPLTQTPLTETQKPENIQAAAKPAPTVPAAEVSKTPLQADIPKPPPSQPSQSTPKIEVAQPAPETAPAPKPQTKPVPTARTPGSPDPYREAIDEQ